VAQAAQDVDAARHEHQPRPAPREQVTPRLRAIGHADHVVALERGVRRHGPRLASAMPEPSNMIRSLAPQEGLSQACLDRVETAARVVPKMQATIEWVSGDGPQQGHPLEVAPPASYALHAHRMPSLSRDRVASTRTVTAGAPLHELAERLRTPLCAPGGVGGLVRPVEQDTRQREAATLAEVFQRSSANVAGRHGALSLRHHQRRGLDHPRKRACLTTGHNFRLTRRDGTTAAERLFGQKPRSMFAAIRKSGEIPPAPLSPPRQAVG
jgi:hypothetical protein